MKTERDSDKCVLADLLSSQDSKSLPMTSCSMLLISDVDLSAWHGWAIFTPECWCVKPEDNRDQCTPLPPSRPGIMLVYSTGILLTPSA